MSDGATIHEFGTGGITARQRQILEAIRDSVAQRGYPPSMREIGEVVGLTSSSSVKHQLTALQAKGYLRQDPNRPRALEVVMPEEADVAADTSVASGVGVGPSVVPLTLPGRTSDDHVDVPLV